MRATTVGKWALLAIAVVVGLAGCHRRSRSHGTVAVADDDIFTTDEFPGGPVQDGNVADDQRGFSTAGENAANIACFFNGNRGTAIALYSTKGNEPMSPFHVNAHYFNGTTWTPPVQLQAQDADFLAGASPGSVAFINTTTHASLAAQERNGDAIVFWSATDIDEDGPALADGPNTCLFATYFDVTAAADPAQRNGFQLLGTRLTVRDQVGEDSSGGFLVTDGLRGERRPGNQRYQYGDETTGIVVVWPQQEENDVLTPFTEDDAFWYCSWDLAATGDPATPLVPRPSARLPVLGFGASDSGGSSEETQVNLNTLQYNNFFFFRVASRATPGSGIPGNDFSPQGFQVVYGEPMFANDDVTLQYVEFDLLTGTFTGPTLLGPLAPDSTDTDESNSQFLFTNASGPFSGPEETQSIYGSDEGLAQLVIFFAVLALDPDAVTEFGSGVFDGRLAVIGIDQETGVINGGLFLGSDDPAIFDTIGNYDVATRISRNGDAIWFAYLQPDAAGASDDLALRVGQIHTTRPAEDGTFTLPSLSTATSPIQTLSSDIDGFDIGWLQFQGGLGYICGAQSDPDVMNLCFEHSNAASDQVFLARLTSDLDVSPVPTVAVTPLESFEEGDMFAAHINQDGRNFFAIDSGEGGNIFAVFRQDIDTTAADTFRLFARRTGLGAGKFEIDSASITRQVPSQDITLLATPAGSSIGTYDPVTLEDSPDRPHPAEIVHVIFREDRFVHGSGTGPALRARAFDTRDTSLSLADAILPPVGPNFLPPFELELPNLDPGAPDGPSVKALLTEDTTVGLWFLELGHLYYQEFTEESFTWLTDNNVSNPILVDDDTHVEIVFGAIVYSRSCTCDALRGAQAFWLKELDPGSGDKRLQVRVRD